MKTPLVEKNKRSLSERLNDCKSTPEYMREQFYNKSRLKLILIVFPALIGLCLLIRKFIALEGYTFYLIMMLAAAMVVNLGAEYLTKVKFKGKEE